MNFIPHFDQVEFKHLDYSKINKSHQEICLRIYTEIQSTQKKIQRDYFLLNKYKKQKL